MTEFCLSCKKPTTTASGVHVACRSALPAGTWAPGIVRQFRPWQPEPITAPPVGGDVWARLNTLTEAEDEVLHLLAIGHSPRDVSIIRLTTLSTARTQISSIRRKFGGCTHAQAVAMAWRSGWITVSTAVDGAA